jgi:hypothetical protein
MKRLFHPETFTKIIFVLLLFAIPVIELGRVAWAFVALKNVARQGARYAATGQYDTAYCTAGCDDAAKDRARLKSIGDILENFASS